MGTGRAGRGAGEKVVLLLLALLALVALAVFLYYVVVVLSGLPDPIPTPNAG